MFLPHCTGKGALFSALVTLALASWIRNEFLQYLHSAHNSIMLKKFSKYKVTNLVGTMATGQL